MSRTFRRNKKGQKVCDKDADWRCKCEYCTCETYKRKERKQVKKETQQEEVEFVPEDRNELMS